MLLPPSLGLFVRQLGARPYVGGDVAVLEPFTESYRYEVPTEDQFGLSGIYTSDNVLKITLAQRDGGVEFATVTNATIGLYRVHLDSRTDELVKTIDIDLDMMFENRFEIIQRLPDPEELVVAALLETSLGVKTAWSYVVIDGVAPKGISVVQYIQRQCEVDVDKWHEPKTTTIQMMNLENESRIELDFHKHGDPKISCFGEVTYSGGGNRYLFNHDGEAIEQAEDEAPWDVDASLFVEPTTSQLFSDFGLHEGKWKYSKDFITLENYQDFDLFPQHRMLSYSIQAPLVNNSTWEWETPKATWIPKTTSFSMYFETTSTSKTLIFEIGVRIYNDDGTLRSEKFECIEDQTTFGMKVCSFPITSGAIGKVSGVVRVRQIHHGDRVVFVMAMPQIEYSGSATSRCWETRLQDLVTYIPNTVNYSTEFGMFRIKFYPSYTGVPTTAGEQWLFDTRSAQRDNGWYLVHKHDGVLEFGYVNADGVEHYVQSASVMQLPQAEIEVTCWYGDFGLRLDVNGNRVGRNTLPKPTTPDMLAVVRLGRDCSESKSMSGELSAFKYEVVNDAVD